MIEKLMENTIITFCDLKCGMIIKTFKRLCNDTAVTETRLNSKLEITYLEFDKFTYFFVKEIAFRWS